MKNRDFGWSRVFILILASAIALPAPGVTGPPGRKEAAMAKTASAHRIKGFVKGTGKQVLTFVGYSGAGYEDPAAMLEAAGRILDRHPPARTLVNIGGTAEGIGAVYEQAKRKGFETMGIVSVLARKENLPLSPYVDRLFFVQDDTWGGRLPKSRKLSPTSAAIVGVSAELVGIGGGEVGRDELLAAKQAGKPVEFIPADLNHRKAIEKAAQKGLPAPTEFRGAVDAAFRPGPCMLDPIRPAGRAGGARRGCP
jgi:hypothetical protein